ncbi:MAG: hypothetical protein IJV05_09945, partial [Muribaculaceae bacterium]|nr:hypothetical protein [Muribaculaceae bacterium]
HVCQWFLTGFYCSTKLGEIPDMAKSWATFCCPGCYKVISKMCCGFKVDVEIYLLLCNSIILIAHDRASI